VASGGRGEIDVPPRTGVLTNQRQPVHGEDRKNCTENFAIISNGARI